MDDPQQISDDAISTTGDQSSVENLLGLRPSESSTGTTVTFDDQGIAPTISIDLTNGGTQTVNRVERIRLISVDGKPQQATVTLNDENGEVISTSPVTSSSPLALPSDTTASSVVVQPQQMDSATSVVFQLQIHACVEGKSHALSSISVGSSEQSM